ncbi:homocysteine S-methyltransferase [Pelomyxa schiedti]|nr:homocysteine S-methyltransferase [Pelomyxa schiedti]
MSRRNGCRHLFDARAIITDGGIETTLMCEYHVPLPAFSAYTLLLRSSHNGAAGLAALSRYYQSYAALAKSVGAAAAVWETPTWKASPRWGALMGVPEAELAEANAASVHLVRHSAGDPCSASGVQYRVSGDVGPRGDCYDRSGRLVRRGSGSSALCWYSEPEADELARYHAAQIGWLAEGGCDLVTGMTMPGVAECVGLARAARSVGAPVVISFTLEEDGLLPCGASLGHAINTIEQATSSYPLYYMLNCVHPTHASLAFASHNVDYGTGTGTDTSVPMWVTRLGGFRPNSSSMTHSELETCYVLDRGDPEVLARQCKEMVTLSGASGMKVWGGCCGTNASHVEAIFRAQVSS